MANYHDIKITEDGDIDLNFIQENTMDCKLIYGDDLKEQFSKIRLKTEPGEVPLESAIGNELYQIIGMPNTKATGEKGKKAIRKALCNYSLLKDNEVAIDAIPTDENEITFIIIISGDRLIKSILKMDIREGEWRFL